MSNKDEKLNFLLEISSSVSSIFNFEALLRVVIEKLLTIMNCSRCSIVLMNEEGQPFIKIGKGFNSPGFVENEKIKKTGWVTKKIISEKKSVLDKKRNFLSVPIIIREKLLGIINLTERNDNKPFSDEENDLLFIFATQIGYTIETIKLHKNIVKMEKLSREMELATVFAKKITKKIDNIENIDVMTFYKPAFDVGGDYFEKIQISEDEYILFLGDVSGKGLYASLIVIMIHSLIKALTWNKCAAEFNLEDFINKLNQMLFDEIGNEITYSTLFFLKVNVKEKEIEYINCGHNFPMYISDSNIEYLKTGGVFIGTFEEYQFESKKIKYNDGDLMFIYSDGVIEYSDDIDYLTQQNKLKDLIKENKQNNLSIILNNIFENYCDFEKKAVNDDVSIVMLRF
ncbi:MAG: GAF domain-containing SpoIIE family protein phosphatase [Candidatus Muiribacteriota bacterium]